MTGKAINLTDLNVKTKEGHPVNILASTQYPYDFGIPQIFLLEKVMMRVAPDYKPKLDHNPLRTFWFPTNGEIPEADWKLMHIGVSYSKVLYKITTDRMTCSQKIFHEDIPYVIYSSDTKVLSKVRTLG